MAVIDLQANIEQVKNIQAKTEKILTDGYERGYADGQKVGYEKAMTEAMQMLDLVTQEVKNQVLREIQPQIDATATATEKAEAVAQRAQETANQAEKLAKQAIQKEPDLSDYVKKDHFYGEAKPGLMTIPNYATGRGGLMPTDQSKTPGGVTICKASKADILEREQRYKPIVPYNLEFAVHSVLKDQPQQIWNEWNGQSFSPDDEGDYIGQLRFYLYDKEGYGHLRIYMYMGEDPWTNQPMWHKIVEKEFGY